MRTFGKLFVTYNKYVARRVASTTGSTFKHIKTQTAGSKNNIGIIELSRPKVNALCASLLDEVAKAMDAFEADKKVGAIILTGNEKVFAAGADIKEMMNYTYSDFVKNPNQQFERIARAVKPTIAAVNGYALGGGCELAMMCDIIYAGENAKFGQPEILIGTIPGAGATQRLIRSVGKSKAMEIILTGNPVSAQEAERMGLVSKVFPSEQVLTEAIKVADKIANLSQIIVQIAKETVNAAYETTLQQGIRFERQMANGTFATADLKEGMKAFVEKRPPNFTHE